MTSSTIALAYDDGDIDTNRTANPHLNDLVAARYSRRQALIGELSAAGAAVFGEMLLSACGNEDDDRRAVHLGADRSDADRVFRLCSADCVRQAAARAGLYLRRADREFDGLVAALVAEDAA